VPSPVDIRWINRLTLAHNYELPELWRLLEYYEGRQRLSYMHPELQATLDERVRQVVINWPRLVVDALEERIDLQGFRVPARPPAPHDPAFGGARLWPGTNLTRTLTEAAIAAPTTPGETSFRQFQVACRRLLHDR
jgi:hypothetical protein